MCSDWLLKLGIVFAIHLPASFWILRVHFPSFLRKKELFDAGLPLVWYILKQLFTSVSVKSGRCLPHHFTARQMSTTIHLHFGKLNIFWNYVKIIAVKMFQPKRLKRRNLKNFFQVSSFQLLRLKHLRCDDLHIILSLSAVQIYEFHILTFVYSLSTG